MGCSAGVIAIDLARQALQVHPHTYALVLSTETMMLSRWGVGGAGRGAAGVSEP